jgi:hypothetical protein
MDSPGTRDNVVDLARFRARKARPPLPLFDGVPTRRLAEVAPFRRLSEREVAHRTRMLAHLVERLRP